MVLGKTVAVILMAEPDHVGYVESHYMRFCLNTQD